MLRQGLVENACYKAPTEPHSPGSCDVTICVRAPSRMLAVTAPTEAAIVLVVTIVAWHAIVILAVSSRHISTTLGEHKNPS